MREVLTIRKILVVALPVILTAYAVVLLQNKNTRFEDFLPVFMGLLIWSMLSTPPDVLAQHINVVHGMLAGGGRHGGAVAHDAAPGAHEVGHRHPQ